ncbi:MAG: glycosyltransferase [Desulfovibrio sp.]
MNAMNKVQRPVTMDPVQMPPFFAQVKAGSAPSSAGGEKTAIALLVLSLIAGILFALYKYPDDFLSFYVRLLNSPWATLTKGLATVGIGVLVWRIILVLTYRPVPACSDEELCLCTVVIPAYNEGSQVLATIRSVMASDYPAEKMQVICVDDGSKDDTWTWMQRGVEEFGERIELVRQPVNKGKRHALYEGFARARGEILVTIDSDSEVEVPTLRRMVSVFCRDSRVGAVAGNVRVLNRHEGFIPKMMDVTFAYSFDFIRASQSRVNTVICTPGALSAYARRAVMPVLDEWVDQTFMGRPANIGEDRAMTNFVLRQGYLVHYQSDAVVFTNVPTTYVCLCKMMLRWARSNVRETISMARFAFTKFRSEPVSGARLNLVMSILGMTVGEVAKLAGLVMLFSWPMLAGTKLLMGALVASLLPAAFYLIRHRSSDFLWAFPYTIYWLATLSWISLYALCTPQRNGWLTRQIVTNNEVRTQDVPGIETLHAAAMPLCVSTGAASLWSAPESVTPCQNLMAMERFQAMPEPRAK